MEQESGRERVEVTGTTRERIENARKRLDIAEKWELPTMDQNIFAIVELADEVKKLSDINASLGSMINDKVAEIDKLEAELAALKEKMRWRCVAKDGWPQTGESVEFILSSAPVVLCAAQMTEDNEIMNKYALEKFLNKEPLWWRPLVLPEMEEEE